MPDPLPYRTLDALVDAIVDGIAAALARDELTDLEARYVLDQLPDAIDNLRFELEPGPRPDTERTSP